MKKKVYISEELAELNSGLATQDTGNVYTVPVGYFDRLPGIIMGKIKNQQEPESLSPLLTDASRLTPYLAPPGYFNGLEEKIMNRIRAHEDYQAGEAELDSLSPLLAGLKKSNPYQVPAGYFDQVTIPSVTAKEEPTEAKVVSMPKRRWMRYAVAAAIVGIIAISGIKIFSGNNSGSVASIEKKLDKDIKNNRITTDEVDDFLELTDALATTDTKIPINPGEDPQSKDYLQDISDDELLKFLDQIPEGNEENSILN